VPLPTPTPTPTPSPSPAPAPAPVAESAEPYFKIDYNNAKEVNKFSICKDILNNRGASLFLPAGTGNEFLSFFSNPPHDVNLPGCGSAYSWQVSPWLTCSGGSGSWFYSAYGTCTGGSSRYSYGSWGACSATCGGGTQSRTYSCVANAGSGTQSRTATCNFTTNSGSQSRSVTCVDSGGATVADANCLASSAKPAISQSCTPTNSVVCGASAGTTQSCTPTTASCTGSPVISQSCNTQACAAASTLQGIETTQEIADAEHVVSWTGNFTFKVNNGNSFLTEFTYGPWDDSSNDNEGHAVTGSAVYPSDSTQIYDNAAAPVYIEINPTKSTYAFDSAVSCPAGYAISEVYSLGLDSNEQEADYHKFTCRKANPSGPVIFDSSVCHTTTDAHAGNCAADEYVSGVHLQQTQNGNNVNFPIWQVTCCKARNIDILASCTFNGVTVPHGSSVTAYANPSSDIALECNQKETRTCNRGVLSGTYQYTKCTVIAPPPGGQIN
jgi:hypothetical protein